MKTFKLLSTAAILVLATGAFANAGNPLCDYLQHGAARDPILANLSSQDLVNLAGTCRSMRDTVSTELERRKVLHMHQTLNKVAIVCSNQLGSFGSNADFMGYVLNEIGRISTQHPDKGIILDLSDNNLGTDNDFLQALLNAITSKEGQLETILVGLILSRNGLQTLPSSIGNLRNLQELWLDLNRLQTLPDSIGNLRSLRELWLQDNQLQSLPGTIGDLRNLEELLLNNNRLQALPGSIGNLRNLQGLWLNNNRLQTLPDSIGDLHNLGILWLNNNHLQALPGSIGNLGNLQQLWLDNNHLQTLPDSIGDLRALKVIGLQNNPQLQRKTNAALHLLDSVDVYWEYWE
jgi:Leucine-rich repeat (LRR) protein